MELSEAKFISEKIKHLLIPFCDKIIICGSIRREQKYVKDIDFCIIPKRTPTKDMFGNTIGYEPIPGFIEVVNSWEKIKGEPTGKYTQRMVEGIKLEISIANPLNFGNLTLIRTGNADFSHMIMKRVLKLGLNQRDGHLYNGDEIIPIRDEIEYFRILNLPYIEPKDRDADAFKRLKL